MTLIPEAVQPAVPALVAQPVVAQPAAVAPSGDETSWQVTPDRTAVAGGDETFWPEWKREQVGPTLVALGSRAWW